MNRWQWRAKTLDKLARTSTTDASTTLLGRCRSAAENAAIAEEFSAAEQIWKVAYRVAVRMDDPDLRRHFSHQQSIAAELDQLASRYRDAIILLAESPDDPTANLHVGRYLCCVRGDFAAGAEHLARCSHAPLKAAAKLELDALRIGEGASTAILSVADAWWSATLRGQPKVVQERLRRHAASLYHRVLDDLSESDRRKVQNRLKSLESA